MLSLGAVLFADGLSIYAYYREMDGNGTVSNSSVNLRCVDLRFNETISEINGRDLYIPLEFAGALSAVMFYVRLRAALASLNNHSANRKCFPLGPLLS